MFDFIPPSGTGGALLLLLSVFLVDPFCHIHRHRPRPRHPCLSLPRTLYSSSPACEHTLTRLQTGSPAIHQYQKGTTTNREFEASLASQAAALQTNSNRLPISRILYCIGRTRPPHVCPPFVCCDGAPVARRQDAMYTDTEFTHLLHSFHSASAPLPYPSSDRLPLPVAELTPLTSLPLDD